MKKFFLLLVFFLLLPTLSQAAGRHVLSISGTLLDLNDLPLDGSFSMTFRIYADEAADSSLWEETQTVLVGEGLYSVELGSVVSFPANLFNADSLFLGIQVEKDSEMTPLLSLASVPWAQQAAFALTAASLINSSVTGAAIASDAITSTHLADGVISSSKIASGAVGLNALANDSVDSSKIADNAVTGTDLATTLTFSDSKLVDLSAINASSATEGLKLPQATSVSSATAEGQISWDSNDDALFVGDGTSAARVARPNVVNVTDTTSQSLTDADVAITDSNPSITLSSATSRVLVTATVTVDADAADDEVNVFKVWRSSDCTGTQVGGTGADLRVFTTTSEAIETVSATFVDSPSTAGSVTYSFCHDNDATAAATVSNDTVTVTITLMEISP